LAGYIAQNCLKLSNTISLQRFADQNSTTINKHRYSLWH